MENQSCLDYVALHSIVIALEGVVLTAIAAVAIMLRRISLNGSVNKASKEPESEV